MATLQELESALRKADAAGNTDDAKALAGEIQKMRAPVAGESEIDLSSMMESSLSNVIRDTAKKGPIGGVVSAGTEGLNNLSELMSRGAYKTGAAVTDAVSPYAPPEVAGGAGYLANVGLQAAPVVLGAGGAKTVSDPVMEWAGKRLMQSALKPTKKALRSGDAQRAIKTLLDEGINVTPGGAAKLEDIAEGLSNEVKGILSGSSATVTKEKVMDAIVEKLKRISKQGNPTADVDDITKVWDEFDSVWPDSMPIELAQEIKQGTQKAVSKKYGELASANIEGQKTLGKGLREAIEDKAPDVIKPNQRNSEILNALGQVEDRALMGGNLNMTGLAGAGSNPASQAVMLADRSALFKSWLARLLHNGMKPVTTGAGATAGAGYGLLSSD